MGRYVYDASLVKQTIEELNNALKKLDSVSSDMKAGINTIRSANGSQYIEFDESKLLALQEEAETVIETDIKTIQGKATTIEEYEAAPVYKKIFAGLGMALTKFGEGVASTVEDLGDGVVATAGFIGGIFNSEFQESCAEYVQKDHVGDWFNKQYETGALQEINKYSWFSKDSLGANLFKGIGSAAPQVVMAMTGVGLAVQTGMAGVSGLGRKMEAGLQEGKSYNAAYASGLWQGTKDAALVYGMGKLAQGIQGRNGQLLKGSADDFAKLTTGSADDVASTAKKVIGCTDDLTAIPLDDGYRLVKAGSDFGDDVGRVIFNGDNVIVTSFDDVAGAAGNYNAATRVISESGDEILYNTAGKIKPGTELSDSGLSLSKLTGQSFDDIASSTTIGKSGSIFKKAGKVKDTKLGKALQTSDDALSAAGSKVANSKVGQAVGKVTSKVTDSKLVNAIQNSKVAQAATQFVTKHPVATFNAASTALTIDKIDEHIITSQSRIVPEPAAEVATVNLPTEANIDTDNGNSNSNTPQNNTTPGGSTGGSPGGSYTGTGGGYTGGGYNSGTNSNPGTSSTNKVEVNTPTTNVPSNIKDEIKDVIGDKLDNITSTITNPGNTNPNNNTQYNPNVNVPGNTNSSTGGSYYPGGSSSSNSGGGGYTDSGFNSENIENTENVELPGGETISGSFSEIIGGNKNTKIPTSSTPITTTTTTSQSKSIIPTIAGLGAAAAAGLGTKAYLDRKENGENEESDFEAEEWEEEDSLNIEYNEEMETERDYLDPTDEYAYTDEPEESYEAVNSSELASMQ